MTRVFAFMISSLLSLYGKSHYPINDVYTLANHVVPLSIGEKRRQPFPPVEQGPLFDQWDGFVAKFPGGKTVKLVHGSLLTCAMGLGKLSFKNSPKIIAVDVGLEFLDALAARWFCKHEFAHLKNDDVLWHYGLLFVSSLATSYFCTEWYEPLMIGFITHIVAENTTALMTEINADSLASEHALEEELRGAIRFFEVCILVQNELSPADIFSNRISRCAKRVFDRHPSSSARIAHVEKRLRSRFGYTQAQLNSIRTDERIFKLKEYFIFREKTPVNDPQYIEKVTKCLQELGIQP